MNCTHSKLCPSCGGKLKLSRLTCSECKAEFPVDELFSPYDYLSQRDAAFLKMFLSCRGNLREVQKACNISYPTAKKRLDDLLLALGLKKEPMEMVPDMHMFKAINKSSTKASDIIQNKLFENGGQTLVYSARGNAYLIQAAKDGKSFLCKELPITPPYQFTVFDVIVDLLLKNGGKARKGNGRNDRLGYGECTEDTVVGAIAKNYAGKSVGSSVFDPVFVLAAVLEWADVAHNCRGYIELTASYRAKLNGSSTS